MNDINLNPLDPDYHIEEFWYGLKQSMINFYYIIKKYDFRINEWSDTLNILKKNKEYNQIECNIREYMSYYAFDLIKHGDTTYHYDILVTNIKRWNKISSLYNFENSTKHNKILTIFLIYLDIKKDNNDISKDFLNTLEPIEEIVENNKFDKFIIYSLFHKKIKILKKLETIPEFDLYKEISIMFPTFKLENTPDISMNKLCKLFRKNYLSIISR
jgi:hypothetical protein